MSSVGVKEASKYRCSDSADVRTLTTLGSCVLRVGGLYQGQWASQWKQIRLYVFSFIFDYRYVVFAPSLSLPSLLWNCLSASLSPSWAFGLHSLQEGASLCPHHPFLFHICSGSTSALAGLASVLGGKVWKEREFLKNRVVVTTMAVGVLRLSVMKAQKKKFWCPTSIAKSW